MGRKRKLLSSGLISVETHLVWTLMGKVQQVNSERVNWGRTVTSLFVKEAEISDLRRRCYWNKGSHEERDTSSSGVTGFTTPRYPSDLFSLQAFPSASTFRFSASFPRRQVRELFMRSCRRSICFLLLMVNRKPHMLAVRGDPLDG
ncbi:hypothetical protein AVEN_125058-1 [Araneus ventricosus]|uniref:Uncharacterized protein n=1 Tax=Araneus ventricosus TaxID=182803 RepID=A0A4Y2GU16_ARAVE|nr:hypothetical protein AVEN_125058-1 [Araneus ventricosus]